MFSTEIRFANRTESLLFAHKIDACRYARDLLVMFDGHESWFDNKRKTYIVTVPQLEIEG